MSSSQPNLSGARAKLGHSLALLEQVEREIAAERQEFRVTGIPPYEVAFRDEVEAGIRWQVCRCTKVSRYPPERWALVVGDAMHNARSALDHLACRLVELNGNTVSNKNAFPIWDRPPTTKEDKRTYQRVVAGMSQKHQEGIQALQPFANPGTKESAMLVALAAHDNFDKHEDLVPLLSTVSSGARHWPSPDPGEVEFRPNPDAEVKPGTEFFRFRAIHGSGEFDIAGVVRIAFGDPSTGLSELEEVRAYCVGIVESFAPDFP